MTAPANTPDPMTDVPSYVEVAMEAAGLGVSRLGGTWAIYDLGAPERVEFLECSIPTLLAAYGVADCVGGA